MGLLESGGLDSGRTTGRPEENLTPRMEQNTQGFLFGNPKPINTV